MSKEQAHSAWRSADVIKRLSDRVVGLGPLGIGLDGLLAFIPGANLVYGVGAGALLMMESLRAKASAGTMARMMMYLAIDNLTDTVPFVGWAADALFPGHLMAANALQKDIEDRHGAPEGVPHKKWTNKKARKLAAMAAKH